MFDVSIYLFIKKNGWGLWASSLPSNLEMSMGLALGSVTDIEYIEI